MKRLRSKRWLRTLLLLAILGVSLYLFRLAVGLGTAWVHYRNTPDFAAYIAGHPVSAETVAKAFNPGDLLSDDGSFLAGPVDPAQLEPKKGEHVRSTRTIEITLDHGEENLLQFSQSFHQSLHREDWVRHGLRIDPPVVRSHPGMRAIAEARVFGLEEMFDADQPGQGGVVLDVVVAAGPGEKIVRVTAGPRYSVVQLDSPGFGLGHLGKSTGTRPLFPWWRTVTGITHNLEELPAEGLVHHLQLVVPLDRRKHDNGSSGPSSQFPKHGVSTPEYSYSWKVEQKDFIDGRSSGSTSTATALTRQWNEKIW